MAEKPKKRMKAIHPSLLDAFARLKEMAEKKMAASLQPEIDVTECHICHHKMAVASLEDHYRMHLQRIGRRIPSVDNPTGIPLHDTRLEERQEEIYPS